MNITGIKTYKANTILLQQAVSSTRPYEGNYLARATKVTAQKYAALDIFFA